MTTDAGQVAQLQPEVDLGCYVYGIVASDVEVPHGLRGVGDQPVGTVSLGEVAALTSPMDSTESGSTLAGRADLLAHSRVLDTLAQLGPVVPVRFGSVLRSSDAVTAELLEPGHDRFGAMLAELAGHTQYTVRARYDERQVLTEIVASNPEIARLRESTRERPEESSYGERVRLGELVAHALEAKSAEDGDAMLAELEQHVIAMNLRESAGIDRLLDVAVLVEDERRTAFEHAVERLAERYAGRARLKLIGPTAPYDFVDAEEPWD